MTILEQLAAYADERVRQAKKKIPLERIRDQALALDKGNFVFPNLIIANNTF